MIQPFTKLTFLVIIVCQNGKSNNILKAKNEEKSRENSKCYMIPYGVTFTEKKEEGFANQTPLFERKN